MASARFAGAMRMNLFDVQDEDLSIADGPGLAVERMASTTCSARSSPTTTSIFDLERSSPPYSAPR